jgi:hypothetical protein
MAIPVGFTPTLDREINLSPEWRGFERRLPEKPRFALNGDHLYDFYPLWFHGADPFALHDQRISFETGIQGRLKSLRANQQG